VFVGDQDGVHMLGPLAAQRFEAPQHLFAAQARINEESGMACLEQRAVARASRRQNGYAERDRFPQSGSAATRCARKNREDDGKLRSARQLVESS
jgi:hypothetical protein